MQNYISTRDSYTATDAQGNTVHFSVIPAQDGEATFLTAKKIARENKLKKVKFFTFVGL